ncbi:MAG: pyridoxal 5'-phosphate synthase glutaminase subunit PdxT [Nitrososphaerales archaeon]
MEKIYGLLLPGGESTVIGGLSSMNGTLQSMRTMIKDGLPVMGTCAGLILLAKRTYDKVVGESKQSLLGTLDVLVERNSYGRQGNSFEADLSIPDLGKKPFRGVFIRAPSVKEIGPKVEVLAKHAGSIVCVKQGKIIGTAFHPELANDLRMHDYFLDSITH